ncbi:hypothetical protein ACJKIH_23415 [Brucella pseudogrignonensis]
MKSQTKISIPIQVYRDMSQRQSVMNF